MRTFLSFDIEDSSIRSKVEALQKDLGFAGADLKLVNPAILHFTIRFLGEIDEAQKEKIISTLEGKIKNVETGITFKGIGVFPSESKISVIWIGIDERSAISLEARYREVNSLLQEAGPLRQDSHEDFNPHVTIARVRSGRNKANLLDAIEKHRNDEFGKTMIGPLRLKLSELGPAGPRYSDIYVFK